MVPLPAVCPACKVPWDSPEGRCPRCQMEYGEAVALLRAACRAFGAARDAARAGRFAEARTWLGAAQRGGLAGHPAVARLEALCDAAEGRGQGGCPWHYTPGGARVAYEEAREAARRGDWPAAVEKARRAVREAPALLPARKMLLLALAGSGAVEEAERLRREAVAIFPEEPDLARWRFAPEPEEEAAAPLSQRPRRRRAPVPRPARRRVLPPPPTTPTTSTPPRAPAALTAVMGALGVTLVAALAVAGMALSAASRARDAALTAEKAVARVAGAARTEVAPPAADSAVPAAATPLPSPQTAPVLSREAAAVSARALLNAAVAAFDAGDWRRAEALGQAAWQASPGDYRGEEGLVLAARAAAARGDRATAAGFWSRVAAEYPHSRYAATARAEAARLGARPSP